MTGPTSMAAVLWASCTWQRLALSSIAHSHASAVQAAEELVAGIPAEDKQFVRVPGAYHELLKGSGSEPYVQAVSDWILAHCQPSKL